MKISSKWRHFRITGPLSWECIHWWIPLTKSHQIRRFVAFLVSTDDVLKKLSSYCWFTTPWCVCDYKIPSNCSSSMTLKSHNRCKSRQTWFIGFLESCSNRRHILRGSHFTTMGGIPLAILWWRPLYQIPPRLKSWCPTKEHHFLVSMSKQDATSNILNEPCGLIMYTKMRYIMITY